MHSDWCTAKMWAEYHLCATLKYDASSMFTESSFCHIYCNFNSVLYIVVWWSELNYQKYEQLNVSQIWQKYFEGKKTY